MAETWGKLVRITSLMFSEQCGLAVPWALPVPAWMLGAMLLSDVAEGNLVSFKELVWVVAQLVIISRMELLVIALIFPFVFRKYKWWRDRKEYLYMVAVFWLRLSYIFVTLTGQLRQISPACRRRLEELANE